MDPNRLKEPTVIVGVAVLVLLVATWIFPSRQADPHLADIKESLEKANVRLGQLEHQLAKIHTGDPSSSANNLGRMADESQQFEDAIALAEKRRSLTGSGAAAIPIA